MSRPQAGQYRFPSGTPVPQRGHGGPDTGVRTRLPQDGQKGSPVTTAPPQEGHSVMPADGRGPVEDESLGTIVSLAVRIRAVRGRNPPG